MKKKRSVRDGARAGRREKLDRRSFVKLLPAAGLAASSVELGALAATAEQQPPAQQRITREMLHAGEQMIGLDFTDAHEAMALPGVNRNLGSYEALRKIDVPLDTDPAVWFHPGLPGKKYRGRPGKPRLGAVEPPKFQNLEDLAFATVPQLATLIRTRKVSPVELTRMYLDRLKRYGT
jgi:hypothetical protein